MSCSAKIRTDVDHSNGNPDGLRVFSRSSVSGEKGCSFVAGGGVEEEGSRKRKQIEESLQRVMYFNCWALS
ncbi:hypothetical protein LINGRAHAP2_LOCUS5392 [Linum grandiflorum]